MLLFKLALLLLCWWISLGIEEFSESRLLFLLWLTRFSALVAAAWADLSSLLLFVEEWDEVDDVEEDEDEEDEDEDEVSSTDAG